MNRLCFLAPTACPRLNTDLLSSPLYGQPRVVLGIVCTLFLEQYATFNWTNLATWDGSALGITNWPSACARWTAAMDPGATANSAEPSPPLLIGGSVAVDRTYAQMAARFAKI